MCQENIQINMEQKIRFKKFKELDLFIQNSLDKYFFVEPWKKLYERTGKVHRDIISDKSTIPDLIIYNKTFNKSDCFIESNKRSFVKFPRMRFILRPKHKKEYNPSVTYGKGNEVYFFMKKESIENNNNNKNKFFSNNKYKHDKKFGDIDEKKPFLKQFPNSDLDNKLIDESKIKKMNGKNWKKIMMTKKTQNGQMIMWKIMVIQKQNLKQYQNHQKIK